MFPHSKICLLASQFSEQQRTIHQQQYYWSMLSSDEQNRAQSFKTIALQQFFIWQRALLRLWLADTLQCDPKILRFKYSHTGKPFIDPSQNSAQLHFSVAHSQDCFLAALSDKTAIGVDIEVHQASLAEQLHAHIFSEHELQSFVQQSPQAQLTTFFQLWTRKEAYLKASGYGLNLSLKDVDCSSSWVKSLHLPKLYVRNLINPLLFSNLNQEISIAIASYLPITAPTHWIYSVWHQQRCLEIPLQTSGSNNG